MRRFVNSLPNDPTNPAANPYRNMHIPGAGVGGHCLPKDPWLLKYGLDTYGSFKFKPNVIVDSRKINDSMPHHMKSLTVEALKEKEIKLSNASIAILGLAFIENSDDTRNTPTLSLYESLEDKCRDIIVQDPYIQNFEGVKMAKSIDDAVRGKDCLILVTRHKEYLQLKPEWLKERMKTPVIVDGRNVFDQKQYTSEGFSFRGVGLPKNS